MSGFENGPAHENVEGSKEKTKASIDSRESYEYKAALKLLSDNRFKSQPDAWLKECNKYFHPEALKQLGPTLKKAHNLNYVSILELNDIPRLIKSDGHLVGFVMTPTEDEKNMPHYNEVRARIVELAEYVGAVEKVNTVGEKKWLEKERAKEEAIQQRAKLREEIGKK